MYVLTIKPGGYGERIISEVEYSTEILSRNIVKTEYYQIHSSNLYHTLEICRPMIQI